jgi:hypothetical protein
MNRVSSVGGVAKKLSERFDVEDIKFLEWCLDNPEIAKAGIKESLETKDNVDFDLFWDAYGYKKSNKEACKRAWHKIRYSEQERILNVEVPKYKRYLEVTGIYKAHPLTYLQSKRYNDDIPTEEVWVKLIKQVIHYYNVRKWKWGPSGEPTVKSLYTAAERMVYLMPNITAAKLCGLVAYKMKTTPVAQKELVTPKYIFGLDRHRLASALIQADEQIREIEVLIENSKALKKLSAESSEEIDSSEEE